MNKKLIFIATLLIIMLILLFVIFSYKLISFIDDRITLSNLEKYSFIENEKIIKSIEYNQKNYVISKYYDNTSAWSHLNLLLKNDNDYYILEKIKLCDTVDDGTNLYIKDNELYIHCTGKEGSIDKYLINDLKIKKETINFNYKNTPNISQLHIGIDKVDDEYIYLSSSFNINDTTKYKPKVKCSFKDKKCTHY